MFNWFNKKKEEEEEFSLEEKYKILVYEKTKEALENGEYTYNGAEVFFNNENIPSVSLFGYKRYGGERKTILVKNEEYYSEEYIHLYTSPYHIAGLCFYFFRNAYLEKIKQEKEERERIEQQQLLEKYNKLLGINPLDEDLKETIRKSERMLEIAEKINSLRDEALSLKTNK